MDMKTKLQIAMLGAMLSLVGSAFGQTRLDTYWAGGSTNASATLNWVIVPVASGAPLVTYFNVTSDKAASVVQFYKLTARAVCNYASATTSFPVNATNGFVAADVVIVRHITATTDSYEKLVLAAFTSSTNLTMTTTPITTASIGDIIYDVTKVGSSKIPCGNATLTANGPGIFLGDTQAPLLAEIDSTAAGNFNAICVTYVK